MIIDTHIHLDLKQFSKDLEFVLKRGKNNNIEKYIIPAIQSNNMDRILELVEKYDKIYFSTGNHPNYLNNFNMKDIEKYILHKKCIAIGECGLDWYRIPHGSNINDIKKRQIKTFEKQIELSIQYKKPLILHSRDTDDDMFNTLMKYKNDLIGGVIHCYVGSEKLLELEKYNFYYGIGGVVTYKSAIDLRKNIKKIPINKILLETDGPFLTPQQKRGERNESSYIHFILNEISSLLNINKNILEKQINENTKTLFTFN